MLKVVSNKVAKDIESNLNCSLSELSVKKLITMNENGRVRVQYMLSKPGSINSFILDDAEDGEVEDE